jgi:hypothetical protein
MNMMYRRQFMCAATLLFVAAGAMRVPAGVALAQPKSEKPELAHPILGGLHHRYARI